MIQHRQEQEGQSPIPFSDLSSGRGSKAIASEARKEIVQATPDYRRIGHKPESEDERIDTAERSARIAAEKNLMPVTSRVLAARGFDSGETLDTFLKRSLESIPDKWEMKDFRVAVEAIIEAKEEGKKIAIACDYDADGATSAAQMAMVLEALEINYEVFATDRYRGGYGLKPHMIEAIAAAECDIIIALDIGTKNHAELELAAEKGIEAIVLDHHEIDEHSGIPSCEAFVNPHRSDCGFAEGKLCAAGITYLVAEGVKETLLASYEPAHWNAADNIDTDILIQLAGCGTIADMMQLQGINRPLVSEALRQLRYTRHEGLKSLKGVSGLRWEVEASDVGFQMGPRINAAGRLIKDEALPGVMNAVNLFLTDDRETAATLAARLHEVNAERRTAEYRTLLSCIEQVEQERGRTLPPALVVCGNDFNPGVVGIVASRLTEIYNRPAVVLAGPTSQGEYVGSARSAHGVHLADALESTRSHLSHFGGHAGAAGCSLPAANLDAFKKDFTAEVKRQVRGKDRSNYVFADTTMTLKEFTEGGRELIKELSLLEPCGRGNPAPRFEVKEATVVAFHILNGRHLEMVVRQDDAYVTALLWQHDRHPAVEVGNVVNLVGRPRIDDQYHFNERRNPLQLEVLAIEEAKHS